MESIYCFWLKGHNRKQKRYKWAGFDRKIKWEIFLIVILVLPLALGHQPRLTFYGDSNEIIVKYPEVSQTFYSILRGNPQTYMISSDSDFNLYLNLLSPAIDGADRDFSAEVYSDNKIIARLEGKNFTWTKFYEEFGGDDYWKGPEYSERASAGNYMVKVFSDDNDGKYVLAEGYCSGLCSRRDLDCEYHR